MGDAIDMEYDTEEGSGVDATVRDEGPGGDAIYTKQEPGDTTDTEGPEGE